MRGYIWAAAKNVMLTVLITSMLFACAAMMEQTIPVDKRISLSRQEGGKGIFTGGQLTMLYNYRMAGNEMTMNGTVSFPHRVDFLNVRLMFLDGDGQVVDRRLVYGSGFRSQAALERGDRTFTQRLTVPPEAAGFSFSYSSQERTGRE